MVRRFAILFPVIFLLLLGLSSTVSISASSPADQKAIKMLFFKYIKHPGLKIYKISNIKVINNYASADFIIKGGETDFCILKRDGTTWQMLDCGSGVPNDRDEWVRKGIPAELFNQSTGQNCTDTWTSRSDNCR